MSAHAAGRPALPMTQEFHTDGAWLDSAYQHPMSFATQKKISDYLDRRTLAGSVADHSIMRRDVMRLFAQLINADVDELSFVPGATTAENYVVAALGLARSGRIVTDSLHYAGSLYLYEQLRDRGVDVTVVEARQGQIDMNDLTRALGRGADLLALSWISALNGFQHDLAEVCRLAHANDTPVYADVVQGVGTVPLDVRAVGVDFCGTSTYKWLMADIGLGFLYVRRDRLAHLQPIQFGAQQLGVPPRIHGQWNRRAGAPALFECGSISNIIVAGLRQSLTDILAMGVANILGHRRELLRHLRAEAKAMGLNPLGPASDGPIVAFGYNDAQALVGPLRQAGVYVTCYEDRIRVAPSVFNSHEDVEALMSVLRDA